MGRSFISVSFISVSFAVIISSFFLIAPSQAQGALNSIYTSFGKDVCVVYESSSLQKDPEIDFLTEECPGLGGYQIMISGGDLRYSVRLRYAGTEIETTHVPSFHDMAGSKIEWLYRRTATGEVSYEALIYRLSVASPSGEKPSEKLMVVKLAGAQSCPVAVVSQSNQMNEKARAIAEKAGSLRCLTSESPSYSQE